MPMDPRCSDSRTLGREDIRLSKISVEEIVTEFCAAWGDGQKATPDIDKIVGMFAENGEWVLSVPAGPTIRGRAAIRAEIERQGQFVSHMQCGILKLISSDSTVVTERLDHFTMRDKRIAHALTAIYELDQAGKILSWREYFDTADMAQQLGMKPDEIVAG
jgi:limonene-1,2-epoxide hydrolase